jgi:AcrR family transcriptional regulator
MTGVERARRCLTSAIPAAARSARSVETRQSILEASERVLERVGYAAFTSRKVAEEAGIAIGNLTYHFPSKAALACHQPIAAEALDRFYRRATRAGVVVVKGSNGAVDERTATELAYLMAMISEGAVVLFGTLPEADRVLPGVQDMAARAVEYLARTLPARAAAVPLPATASASDQ